MYTRSMTGRFRILVSSIALVVALVPQLACFMPDSAATSADMECCRLMMDDCSGMNMSQECCPPSPLPDVAIVVKALRINMEQIGEAVLLNTEAATRWTVMLRLPHEDSHLPPDSVTHSPLILRI
jgi:hypothetical protein